MKTKTCKDKTPPDNCCDYCNGGWCDASNDHLCKYKLVLEDNSIACEAAL